MEPSLKLCPGNRRGIAVFLQNQELSPAASYRALKVRTCVDASDGLLGKVLTWHAEATTSY